MDERLWRRRWHRALLVAAVLRCLPFVRMVGLNGSLVTGTFHEGSDIDFFIVLKEGRIFSGRALVTLIVQVLGVRRHGKKVAGRVCLNRYATADFLQIGPPNEYHARVFHNLIPLYACGDVYERYQRANRWMESFGYPVVAHRPYLPDGPLVRILRLLSEMVLLLPTRLSEKLLKNIQLQRLASDARAKIPGSRVIVTDQELCFHLLKEI